ncbi:hypothetical protein L2D14_11865 [Thalassospiraceae bacterium LMO-JJ14]|nr:hypothetical protein L2D14_11865 [Thalassospiraceae bacterium LMO-JJ14]
MRIDQPPLPLDIARLNVGPSLREKSAGESAEKSTAEGRGRALVAYRDPPGRDLVADRKRTDAIEDIVDTEPAKELPPPKDGYKVPDVRHMTPREMQDYSQNLYAAGVITFEDYEALAFQPELHPDFARTIGALTGEKAQPDRPRDYIRQWNDRVDYTQRYYPQNSEEVRQAHRIHEALMAFPRRTDIFV